jgi:hypothetical protein
MIVLTTLTTCKQVEQLPREKEKQQTKNMPRSIYLTFLLQRSFFSLFCFVAAVHSTDLPSFQRETAKPPLFET